MLELVDHEPIPARAKKSDDEFVKKARPFVLKWLNSDPEDRRSLYNSNKGLYWALSMFERDTSDRSILNILEARLLTGEADKPIADEVATYPEAVAWYERLFFNVRDRLRARDWILRKAIMPAVDNSWEGNDVELSLKYFGYFGGKILLDFILTGANQGFRPKNHIEAVDYTDEHFMSNIKRRSAMNVGIFDVNRYTVMDLFQTHARIIELQKSIDLEEDARNQIERNIKTLMDEMPFAVGRKGQTLSEASSLGEVDKLAAEARDEEIQLLAAGSSPHLLNDELESIEFREPGTHGKGDNE